MNFHFKNVKLPSVRLWLVLIATLTIGVMGLCLVVSSAWNAARRHSGARLSPEPHELQVFQNLNREKQEDERERERMAYFRENESWSTAASAEREELSRLYHPFEFSRFHKQSWNWEYLLTGDRALVATICTSFEREFFNTFKGSYSNQVEVCPEREKVVNVMLERLFEDLAKAGTVNAREIVSDIADFVALQFGEKAERLAYVDGQRRWHKGASIDVPFARQRTGALTILKERRRWELAIERIPQAYALYFESLVSERSEAVKLMDRLVALQSEHSGKLRAVAKYRRARLLMCMEDWDVLSDEQAKARISGIKRDLKDVQVHVTEGGLNPSKMSESAPYWIAHCQSMILRPDRLVRIGEADYAAAFRTYLTMPQMAEGNAVNSCKWLASHLASSKEVIRCASDPMLRELITIYYCSLPHGRYGLGHMAEAEGRYLTSLWLEAIGLEPEAAHCDPTKLALLQYQVGRWTDCFMTAGFLKKSDPLRALLRSRCALRLAGDMALARRILDAGLGIGTDDHALPKMGSRGFQADAGDPIYVNLSDRDTLRARLEGERAMVALSSGDFSASYVGFHRSGSQKDAEYVGECLLTTNEMRQCVLAMTSAEIEVSPAMNPTLREELNPMEHLITKLYRDGRVSEAVSFMKSPLKERTELYLRLIAQGEDEGLDRRSRASAYWRAAMLASHLGNRIFRSPVGADHSSDAGWYMPYGFLPWMRYAQARRAAEEGVGEELPELRREKLLFEKDEYAEIHSAQRFIRVTEPELRRVTQWMETHLVRERLAERDPDYEVMRLALLAVRLLPNDDQTGAQILQHVGGRLKYKDPKGAQPAYRVLATRFKQTTYGSHAFKRRWFSDDFTYPDIYILEER